MTMPNRLAPLLAILLATAGIAPAQTTRPALVDGIAARTEAPGGMASVVSAPGMEHLVVPLVRALPPGFYVHALVGPEACLALRQRVMDAELSGRIAVCEMDRGGRLPYASDLLNLLVLAGASTKEWSAAEMLRVLAPFGCGCANTGPGGGQLAERLRRAGAMDIQALPGAAGWLTFRKPWPDDMGEWSHHLHGPDNNPVTPDLRVGPPRCLQWTAGPRWSRNHESAGSLPAMVSAGGRLFAVVDEGPIGISAESVPDKWMLIARDAFNGRVLWKRPIGDWGWRSWRKDWITRSVPPSMARGLVAIANRVIATDGFRGEVLILDAANGKLLCRCHETRGTDELIVSKDAIFTVQQTEGSKQRVRALSIEDGRTLWAKAATCHPQTLCASDAGVFWWDGETVVAHDCASGSRRWTSGKLKRSRWGRQYNLIATENTILAASHGYHGVLTALDAASGRQLWQTRCRGGYVFSPPDLFVIDGTVWADGYFEEWLPHRDRKHIAEGKKKRNQIPAICRWPTFMRMAGRDLRTGQLLREIDTGGMFKTGHQHRCYRCRATSRVIMAGRRGTEFVDLQGRDFSVDNWVRGSCQFGFMPANGLLYATPHPCACYLSAKLNGFNALAAGEKEERGTGSEERERYTRGPAFGESPHHNPQSADWPAYRCDVARSGSTLHAVPAVLRPAWSAPIGGRLTQPVVVGSTVLVVQVDAGTLHAFDRASGQRRWRFAAGGRIDSAPSIADGHVFFGCHDGWLYCLRLRDGALAWQRRLAPQDRFIGDHGQLASAWPVHGAVLVADGVVYAAAGRASVLDGGIQVWAIDAATGAVRHQTALAHTFDDPRKMWENDTSVMRGFLTDVLLREEDSIFMRHAKLDLALNPQERNYPAFCAARLKHWGKTWKVCGTPGDRPHLVAGSGLLDDTLFNRMIWVRGNASGQLIVWDEHVTCTVNMFHVPKRKLLSPVFFPDTDGVLIAGRQTLTAPSCPNDTPFEPPADACLWQLRVPVRVEAMMLAGDTLFIAGQPDHIDPIDPLAAFEGRAGGKLIAIDSRTGKQLHELTLASPPIFDGLAAAHRRLWLSARDGKLRCFVGAVASSRAE